MLEVPQGQDGNLDGRRLTIRHGADASELEVLDQNLAVAVNFQPLTGPEMAGLRDRCRKFAADGRYELFKMTTKYDGKVGREHHHFPTVQELPL